MAVAVKNSENIQHWLSSIESSLELSIIIRCRLNFYAEIFSEVFLLRQDTLQLHQLAMHLQTSVHSGHTEKCNL